MSSSVFWLRSYENVVVVCRLVFLKELLPETTGLSSPGEDNGAALAGTLLPQPLRTSVSQGD